MVNWLMNGNISQEGEKCPNSQNEHSKCFRQAQGQQRCHCGSTVSYTFRVYDAFFFIIIGFPGGSDDKASACNVGDPCSIPGLGRSPGEGNGNPFQYSCLENPWIEEPGRLQSMWSQRVGHNWATSLSLYYYYFRVDCGAYVASDLF